MNAHAYLAKSAMAHHRRSQTWCQWLEGGTLLAALILAACFAI